MGLSDDDVREILRLIDEAGPDELRVETAGFSLHVVREQGAEGAAPAAAAPAAEHDGAVIVAPMPGTFYRAPAPGAAPFVEAGTRVDAGTIVGIIEVMKMMNSIPAGIAGTIVSVEVENGEAIEHGQPLFRIEP